MAAHPVQQHGLQHEEHRPGEPGEGGIGDPPDQQPSQHALQRAAGDDPHPPVLVHLHHAAQRLEGEGQQRDGIRIEDGRRDFHPEQRVEPRRHRPGREAKVGPAQPVLHRVGADLAGEHPAGVGRRHDLGAEDGEDDGSAQEGRAGRAEDRR
jgi:hypothetical protein